MSRLCKDSLPEGLGGNNTTDKENRLEGLEEGGGAYKVF